jgi:uncharacterized cupin superfamily protein
MSRRYRKRELSCSRVANCHTSVGTEHQVGSLRHQLRDLSRGSTSWARHATPPRLHGREDETLLVIDGEIHYVLDDDSGIASAGDAVFAAARASAPLPG